MAQSALKLNSAAFDACNRAVIISGCGRSGTTILGQVLHSMEGVEYCFEGPMLVSLFAAMPTMPTPEWKLLYETYLYEEVLINALCGRGLNCNRRDDSSIYKVKDLAVVKARLAKSKRKIDAAAEARDSVIAYKVPDIAPYLKRIASLYPGSRFVLLNRRADDTINSILQKKWFSDDALKTGLLTWPNRMRGATPVPYWIREAHVDYWVRANEVNRAAYYYAFMTDAGRGLENATIVDYDKMLKDPVVTIESLAQKLGLQFGSKTRKIIATIKKTKANSQKVDVLSSLDRRMRRMLANLENVS